MGSGVLTAFSLQRHLVAGKTLMLLINYMLKQKHSAWKVCFLFLLIHPSHYNNVSWGNHSLSLSTHQQISWNQFYLPKICFSSQQMKSAQKPVLRNWSSPTKYKVFLIIIINNIKQRKHTWLSICTSSHHGFLCSFSSTHHKILRRSEVSEKELGLFVPPQTQIDKIPTLSLFLGLEV